VPVWHLKITAFLFSISAGRHLEPRFSLGFRQTGIPICMADKYDFNQLDTQINELRFCGRISAAEVTETHFRFGGLAAAEPG
jgi:hypothetical protein